MDDDEKYDLSRKNSDQGPSDFDRAMMIRSSVEPEPEDTAKPSWAAAWEAQEAAKKRAAKVTRLKGTVVTWNKGFGFIKPDMAGQSDIYVHQRNVQKKGFRSLLVGEPVEFEMGKMQDGKLEALQVSGPGGAEPKGQKRPSSDSDDDDDEAEKTKAPLKAQQPEPKRTKPATTFVPRTVKRPAGKPAPKPAPKPAATAAASPAAAAAPPAPPTSSTSSAPPPAAALPEGS